MAAYNAAAHKPPDETGTKGMEHGRDTTTASITPTTTNTMSYADRLKTNVRHDHRLKRNVLEITIEKDKEVRVDLDPVTVARILNSIGLDIGNQVEGYQIIYGRVCLISVWVVKGVTLDRFCQKENIIVSKGVVAGTIRPAGRRDVIVTVAGVDFDTPDALLQEYIQKFGGKLMSQNVSYGRYSEGPFIGKINNERKYQVDFSDSKMKMGTYHFLDGARVRVYYRGNEKTCGRCHEGQSGCPGGGLAKECERKGGERRLLTDHMRKLWGEIGFTPTSFQLPDEVESTGDEDTKDGDRPITEVKVPEVNRPEISEETMKKLTSLKINNLPHEITENEVVKLLKERVKSDLESVNFEITRTPQRNTIVVVFSGLNPEDITKGVKNIDFKETKEKFYGKPLYCRAMRNLTPVKENAEPKENENTEDPPNEEKVDKPNEDEIVKPSEEVTIKPKPNEEKVDKPNEDEIVKQTEEVTTKPKPTFRTKSTPNTESNKIMQYLSPSRPPKSLYASAIQNGEIPLEETKPKRKKSPVQSRK
jgi:hypothetical protein